MITVAILMLVFLSGIATAHIARPKRRLTIHMREGAPASGMKHSKCACVWGCYRNAVYLDADGNAWCEHHGHRHGHGQLERAVTLDHKTYIIGTGRCVVHDMDCPKPWEAWKAPEPKEQS